MKSISRYQSSQELADTLAACIGCQECLFACPAIIEPIPIGQLNHETFSDQYSPAVTRFARDCSLCGACIPACPVGIDRSAMMLWIKIRLIQPGQKTHDPTYHTNSVLPLTVPTPLLVALRPILRYLLGDRKR